MQRRRLGERRFSADRGDVPGAEAVLVAGCPGGLGRWTCSAPMTGIGSKAVSMALACPGAMSQDRFALPFRTFKRAPQPGAEIRELAGRAGLKGRPGWPAICSSPA